MTVSYYVEITIMQKTVSLSQYCSVCSVPISTSVEIKTDEGMVFPKVTICNTNPVQYSLLNSSFLLQSVLNDSFVKYELNMTYFNMTVSLITALCQICILLSSTYRLNNIFFTFIVVIINIIIINIIIMLLLLMILHDAYLLSD